MTPPTVHVDHHLLRIYLSDHVAGAAGALARVRRMARSYRGTPLGGPLADLANDLARERSFLLELAERLDVRLSRWKSAAAGMGERIGRLKPNGRLTSASPPEHATSATRDLRGAAARRGRAGGVRGDDVGSGRGDGRHRRVQPRNRSSVTNPYPAARRPAMISGRASASRVVPSSGFAPTCIRTISPGCAAPRVRCTTVAAD